MSDHAEYMREWRCRIRDGIPGRGIPKAQQLHGRVESVCEICGKRFLARPSVVNRGKARTCSVRCRCVKASAASKKNPHHNNVRHGLTAGGKRVLSAARAASAVTQAIRKGQLVRPSVCSRCGGSNRIEAHHADYSKPLDVEWLCRRCHNRHHCVLESNGIRPGGLA